MKEQLHIQVWETDEPEARHLICLTSINIGELIQHGSFGRKELFKSPLLITKGFGIYGDEVTFEKLKAGEVVSFKAGTNIPV